MWHILKKNYPIYLYEKGFKYFKSIYIFIKIVKLQKKNKFAFSSKNTVDGKKGNGNIKLLFFPL